MRDKVEVGFFPSIIRGILFTAITALILVLAFAFVAKFATLGEGVMKVVNQFIKVLAIFLGCIFSPYKRLGLIKGGLIGVFGAILIYLLFSLLLGQGVNITSILIDLIFSLVVGCISGVISVNLKGE